MLATLAQYTYEYQNDFEIPAWLWVVYLGLFILFVAAMWRIFNKAGESGWYALIPILNTYTLCKVAGRPGWWWVLMFIPCVGTVIGIIVLFDLAKAFGKGGGFGLGLVFLPPIFIPILAFGSATHFTSSRDRYSNRNSVSSGYGNGFDPSTGAPNPGGFTPGAGLPSAPPLPPAAPLPSLPSLGSPSPFDPQGSSAGAPTPPAQVSQTPGAPAPGWYPDPAGSAGVRWWDGAAWTEHLSG